MFGRLIGKISYLARTATLRGFSQENGIDNKQKKPVRIKRSVKEFSTSLCTFKDMAQPGNIFIDKSLLIEKLLNTNNTTFLFTRPRRWGKTLNIDMLETFFQADVDETSGIPNFEKQSQKYLFEKLKIKNKKIIKDPISGNPSCEKIIEFQGQFPVINLTVNESGPKNQEGVIEGFEEMLRPAFKKHSYILNSNIKSSINHECKLIESYVYDTTKKITWGDIGKSLNYLIDALYKVYDRRVVLLVDEYDRDLNILFAKGSSFYSSTLELYKLLLNPIKNNKKLLLTVFTGATKMVKSGIFTGLNHFTHDSVFQSEFSEFFGFTEAEVDLLLNTLVRLNPKLQRKEVKDFITMWYNGYRIGQETIYNPWSIMHCFNSLHKSTDKPYRPYWVGVGSTELIEKAIKAIPSIEHIEELIINGQTELKNVESFTFEEINTNETALFSLLLDSGYITKLKDDIYKVPNYEVNFHFIKNLLPLWLEKRFPKLNLELLKNNFEITEAYGQTFQQELLDRLEYTNHNEKYFQLLVTLQFDMQKLKEAGYVKNKEQQTTGSKRIDILLTPVKLNLTSVFILELKKAETFGSISRKIKEALLQVFEKNYVDFVLHLAEKPENMRWNNFRIRAIVFSPDELNKKWILTIKELQFDKENLQKAIKEFEMIKKREDKKDENDKEGGEDKDEEDKKEKKYEEDNKDKENIEEKKKKKNEVDEKLIETILSLSNSLSEYPKKSNN